MTVTSGAGLLQQWILIRRPELQTPQARGTLRLLPAVLTTSIMVIALTTSALFPRVGLYTLLLLFVVPLIEKLIQRRRRGRTPA